jgi:hypothetical protein
MQYDEQERYNSKLSNLRRRCDFYCQHKKNHSLLQDKNIRLSTKRNYKMAVIISATDFFNLWRSTYYKEKCLT